ncbi:helix-turn-helix transcriptional regulator [Halomonas chromatireducens]|uniref:Prophage CP4-57 regulatory protein (AlpA) n=1 Tax=Halomonas chromatireducens TaxID=507626 RepID=A0A0X8HH30_9GAMM|nr:AlpA family transcriptional regulator [Halomonas chromatireducens]AMD02491.1 Prophage CP4-57 regulatory protein (AlpA) [Halomonas chromatireducens]
MANIIREAIERKQQRLLRRPDVLHRCGISNSTLHRLINTGDFPAPVPLSPRAVAWVETEIDHWIEERISQARPNRNGANCLGGTQ